MTNFLDTNSSDSSAGHGARLTSYGNPLILIVEDHEDTRFMLRTILEMRGMRVAEAVDGEAGVRVAEETRPDLILMDGTLPRLDGLGATRLIRESETLRGVPVVILSGHAAPKSQEAAFAAGCSDYLVKPLDFDQLYRILHKHLTLCPMSTTANEKRAFERNRL
jgi:CheY-like chemotaxis protein